MSRAETEWRKVYECKDHVPNDLTPAEAETLSEHTDAHDLSLPADVDFRSMTPAWSTGVTSIVPGDFGMAGDRECLKVYLSVATAPGALVCVSCTPP